MVITVEPFKNAEQLEAELKTCITGEVRFDSGSKALYSTDASNYRQIPIGVVIPKSIQDVTRTIDLCRKYNAPLLTRGGGTSLAGQCCNVAVVMDFSKYLNNILHIDRKEKTVTIEAGVVLDHLKDKIIQNDLLFAPDPATHSHCTLGGMIGNNSCGIHSLLAVKNGLGMRTSDSLKELKIATYDGVVMKVGKTSEEDLEKIIQEGGRKGEIYQKLRNLRDKYAHLIRERFPKIPRRVSGYNLDELLPENGFNVARALAGTEGTCVTYLEAKLTLVDNPQARSLVVLGYPDVYAAGEHCKEILKYQPIGLEGIDEVLMGYLEKRGLHTENLKYFPEGKGWLLVEFGANSEKEAHMQAKAMMNSLSRLPDPPSMRIYEKEEDAKKIWEIRESGLGATAFVPNQVDTWPGWEDSAVHPDDVGSYLKDLRTLFQKYNYSAALYGHFGQGCIHCRISFDLVTDTGIRKYKEFLYEAADLVVKYGGSLSGEHGDGQARGILLEKLFGPDLMEAFREFKRIWDPYNKMNPGKIVNANPVDANLRLGSSYNPKVKTYFSFHQDNYDFSRATLRCVGVGKCRRDEGGVMCPSYMVTREEKHTTRGRARILYEMLKGESITDGWKSEEVKDALDLCLSCKGCKNDCPVNVDMATYKSEFLAHYYKGKLRSPYAYAFGFISTWSRIGSKAPALTNFVLNAPGIGKIARKITGIATERKIPKYSRKTFKDWFNARSNKPEGNKTVILWPDTFNNYFQPNIAIAAVNVLEKMGYSVKVPMAHLCCGRPLYDFGFLDTAKKWLKQIIKILLEDIRKDTPIIGLEPSCVAVFRDELRNLFPKNKDAFRLSNNVYLLTEFIDKFCSETSLPQIKKKALIHIHCHHHSVLKPDAELRVLKKMGIEGTLLNSGCCGMAGSFGFEEGKYDVSVKAAERVLIPAVRKADESILVITNGFSCSEQIKQLAKRKSFHIAEVLDMAFKNTGSAGHLQSQRPPHKEKILQRKKKDKSNK